MVRHQSFWPKVLLSLTHALHTFFNRLLSGTRLRRLPRIFDRCNRLLVTTWGHDPSEIPVPGALTMLLDALQHSSVLVQAYSITNEQETETKFVPYPPLDAGKKSHSLCDFQHHIQNLLQTF